MPNQTKPELIDNLNKLRKKREEILKIIKKSEKTLKELDNKIQDVYKEIYK